MTRAASATEVSASTVTVSRSPAMPLMDLMARVLLRLRILRPSEAVCYTRPMGWRGIFRPGMRAYFVPLIAGVLLVISAFLPWVVVGEARLTGFPDMTGLWIIGLGAVAALLAMLSLITRKNSRHPL